MCDMYRLFFLGGWEEVFDLSLSMEPKSAENTLTEM